MRVDVKDAVTKAINIVLVLGFVACADLPEIESYQTEEKLLDGVRTDARPEVGRFDLIVNGQTGLCTATLIRPNIAITAAHCVSYLSGASNFGSVTFNGSRFSIRGALSFSQELGAEDIALLELSNSVPNNVATPALLHQGTPSQGAQAEIFGFGCNDRGSQNGALLGSKQTVRFTVGEGSQNLCPGDSGGPVFVNNAVAWVNSAYYIGSGRDLFAEVGAYNQQINRYADQLSTRGTAVIINELNAGQSTSQGETEQNQTAQRSPSSDECADQGYYGDGYCDSDCARPDPDCHVTELAQQPGSSDEQVQENSNDICVLYNYYDDGECDVFCNQPDPDCE